jgi:CheY-like chemotaxis protein
MKTILLVDDEYALVETLTDLLTDEGYRVVSAANGEDGLDRVRDENPDLVVTDFMMPIADGRQLVRGIRALPKFKNIPIIMMSSTTKSVALSDSNGTIDVSLFLKKPCSWASLRDAIAQLLPS